MPAFQDLETILRLITKLKEDIAKGVVPDSEEYRKRRALGILDGVETVLRASCEGGSGSFFEFTYLTQTSSSSSTS